MKSGLSNKLENLQMSLRSSKTMPVRTSETHLLREYTGCFCPCTIHLDYRGSNHSKPAKTPLLPLKAMSESLLQGLLRNCPSLCSVINTCAAPSFFLASFSVFLFHRPELRHLEDSKKNLENLLASTRRPIPVVYAC